MIQGLKDIENRDWKIGRAANYGSSASQKANFRLTLPALIYVHAGKGYDYGALDAIKDMLPHEQWDIHGGTLMDMENNPASVYRGAIIGEIEITDCVTESDSPWFCGRYGFLLARPVIYCQPVPCKGRLGFWQPEPEIEAACAVQRVDAPRDESAR